MVRMVRPTQILDTLTHAPRNGSAAHAQPVPAPSDWRTDAAVPILKNLLRLTAPNPGVMTGPGTNSYLVGDAQSGFIAIDPGPADARHLQRLFDAAVHPQTDADGRSRGGNIQLIVCTHSHPDHSPGAKPLQAMCALASTTTDAPPPAILGLPSAPTARAASEFTPDRALLHGELLQLQGDGTEAHTLKVLHTPGHAANHVCLLMVEDGMLFSGDHVLNGSTTVVDPPDGNMVDYIASLDLLHSECSAHAVQFILPAHGHVIMDALGAISHLKAHRLRREAKIAAVMQANPDGTLDQWLPLAYDDVDPRIWPVARRSLLAHVERIQWLQAHKGCA